MFEPTIHGVELCAAWMGFIYAWRTLQANHLVIEGGFAMVVAWIQGYMREGTAHPLL